MYTSSLLLSSSPDIWSGEDGLASKEWVFCPDRSAEASLPEASLYCGELVLGLVVPLGIPHGALATLSISSPPSSSASEPRIPSSLIPPFCLILPCRGSNVFLWRTLVLPPATPFTAFTGTPGEGWPTTWYSSLSHLSCILCLPFQVVCSTRTRFPSSSSAPLHLWSYSSLGLVFLPLGHLFGLIVGKP